MEPRARLSDRARWRPEGSGCLIYDMELDTVSRGNVQGRVVLEACRSGRSVPSIAREFSTRYGIGEAHAGEDVTRFLNTLVAAGLAEWVHGPA